MLPAASFHQTVANTLSAERFKQNILRAGIEQSYPAIVKNAFNNTWVNKQPNPICMKLVGLSVFGTAISVLGTFENKADYNRIINFRAGFYEDEQLAGLDVKMTRPFIGHITLAYAEQKLNKNQRDHLANTINDINEQVFSKKHYFVISNTGLRRYEHLAEFQNAGNYPVYQFTL
jgi:2'-5' RNA ligase